MKGSFLSSASNYMQIPLRPWNDLVATGNRSTPTS